MRPSTRDFHPAERRLQPRQHPPQPNRTSHSRPCTCSSAPSKAKKQTVRCSFSAGCSCPRGRPTSSARASGRCATRGGDAEAPPPVVAQLPGHAERLVLEGARQHFLLAGQLEAHAPQAPHALAQERLHLGPGVPIVRALGADHPVPLKVKEVGLVRELQDGGGRVTQRRLTRCATCSSARWAGCLVMARTRIDFCILRRGAHWAGGNKIRLGPGNNVTLEWRWERSVSQR